MTTISLWGVAKYDPLSSFLGREVEDAVEMSFVEVEALVGPLPPSARRLRQWWANVSKDRVQSAAWLRTGRRVEHVDLSQERVRFSRRIAGSQEVRGSNPDHTSSKAPETLRARPDDSLGTLQAALPYPIARALRSFGNATDERDRLQGATGVGESLILWLGIVGLAWCKQEGVVATGGVRSWYDALTTRGVSLGVWLGAARDAAAAARKQSVDLGGFADALRPQNGRGLLGHLDAIVTLRNSQVHGANLMSSGEVKSALSAIDEAVRAALQEAEFLTHSTVVLVQKSSLQRTGEFRSIFRLASGDHPDFQVRESTSSTPYVENEFYVLSGAGGRDLNLSPFLLARDCTVCSATEIYYPDKLQRDALVLNSFERGHSYQDFDVLDELNATPESPRGPSLVEPNPIRGSAARRPAAVTRLAGSSLLPPGSLLHFNLGAVSSTLRPDVSAWLATEPLRGVSTWSGDPQRPLSWELDGLDYSPTGLAQTIIERSTGSKPAIQGPLFWIDDFGASLVDLADQSEAAVPLPAQESQARLISAWAEVPDDDISWSIIVRNGSEEPVFEVRAWAPQRLIGPGDPDGRWVGAMHEVLPPQREYKTTFEFWPIEPGSGSPSVTLEFTDARGQDWRRGEINLLVPLIRRHAQPMVNDDNVDDPFLW